MSKILLSEPQLLGVIAKWGIRQSPYHRPDNLETVLDKVHQNVAETFVKADLGFVEFSDEEEVKQFAYKTLENIPEWVAWNDRKNGNDSPFGFTSRYDRPDPDNDFIDLDAMVQNIAREITLESQNVPF